MPGSGQERLDSDAWATSTTPCSGADPGRVSEYPSGATDVEAVFNSSGYTQSEDMMVVWHDPNAMQFLGLDNYRWDGAASGCHSEGLSADTGYTLPDGSYAVDVYSGGTLTQVASQTTNVGGPVNGSITVSGRIIDADTGGPIEGAYFIILKPGVDPGTWYYAPDETQALATGVANSDGTYAAAPPVADGDHGFIVEACGYQAVGGQLKVSAGGSLEDIALTPLS